MNPITVPNNESGRSIITQLRRYSPLRVRGRHPDRKSLIGPYRRMMAERFPNGWAQTASDEQIHRVLRQDVPLRLAQTLKVYFNPIPRIV